MSRNASTTCKHCKLRPAFPGYEYCGKTCGRAAKAQAPTAPSTPSSNFLSALFGSSSSKAKASTASTNSGLGASTSRAGGSLGPSTNFQMTPRMCIACRIRPAHGTYDHCSKSCARAAPKPAFGSPFLSPRRTPQRSFGTIRVMNTRINDDDDDDYTDGDGDGDGDGDEDEDAAAGPPRQRATRDLVLARRGPPLCINCHIFPKIPPYDYCSRSCKTLSEAKLSTNPPASPSLSPQFTGAGLFLQPMMTGTAGPSSSSAPSSSFLFPMPTPYGGPPPPYTPSVTATSPRLGPPCSIPGCSGFGPTLQTKYCTDTCAKAAVQQGLEIACLLCQSLPKIGLFHWCGPVCRQKAESGAPMLIELPKSDPKFADIVNQFTKSWSPLKGAVPAVHKIFKCMNTKAAEDRFQQYRQNVEADGAFVAQGKTAGNENRRWHGTIRRCKIGDTSINLTPCSSATCFVCCIIKTGFDINYAAKGWYGTGLYCSSHSSTSNGYTKGAAPGSPYRAMFLNRVIVGTEYVWGKTKGKDLIAKALVSPPDGYDSVASDAKHDEIIVYRNDAMVPSWLILYG